MQNCWQHHHEKIHIDSDIYIFRDRTTYFKTEKQIKHTHTVRITILIKHELALAAAIKYKLMHNSILTMPRLRPNLAD